MDLPLEFLDAPKPLPAAEPISADAELVDLIESILEIPSTITIDSFDPENPESGGIVASLLRQQGFSQFDAVIEDDREVFQVPTYGLLWQIIDSDPEHSLYMIHYTDLVLHTAGKDSISFLDPYLKYRGVVVDVAEKYIVCQTLPGDIIVMNNHSEQTKLSQYSLDSRLVAYSAEFNMGGRLQSKTAIDTLENRNLFFENASRVMEYLEQGHFPNGIPSNAVEEALVELQVTYEADIMEQAETFGWTDDQIGAELEQSEASVRQIGEMIRLAIPGDPAAPAIARDPLTNIPYVDLSNGGILMAEPGIQAQGYGGQIQFHKYIEGVNVRIFRHNGKTFYATYKVLDLLGSARGETAGYDNVNFRSLVTNLIEGDPDKLLANLYDPDLINSKFTYQFLVTNDNFQEISRTVNTAAGSVGDFGQMAYRVDTAINGLPPHLQDTRDRVKFIPEDRPGASRRLHLRVKTSQIDQRWPNSLNQEISAMMNVFTRNGVPIASEFRAVFVDPDGKFRPAHRRYSLFEKKCITRLIGDDPILVTKHAYTGSENPGAITEMYTVMGIGASWRRRLNHHGWTMENRISWAVNNLVYRRSLGELDLALLPLAPIQPNRRGRVDSPNQGRQRSASPSAAGRAYSYINLYAAILDHAISGNPGTLKIPMFSRNFRKIYQDIEENYGRRRSNGVWLISETLSTPPNIQPIANLREDLTLLLLSRTERYWMVLCNYLLSIPRHKRFRANEIIARRRFIDEVIHGGVSESFPFMKNR